MVDVHLNDAPAGVHVNELVNGVRCLPGATGVVVLNTFFGALTRPGYDDPAVVEPFNAPLRAMIPEDAMQTTAAALSRVWRSCGA